MKKFWLLATLSTLPLLSIGADLCSLEGERTVTNNVMPKIPNYFFKTSEDGRFIYYIADNQNWLYDTVTKKETPLPGQADPVPSADGKILTSLSRDPKTNYWLISVNEMKNNIPVGEAQTLTDQLGGSYQSVGSMAADGSFPVLFFDEMTNEIIVKKLLKDKKGNFALSDRTKMFVGGDYRLPMMSPDGKRFSALNVKTNNTEIFELDAKGKEYKIKKTLPFAGGKASFSSDGEKVTFHLNREIAPVKTQTLAENLYPHILSNEKEVRDIYVYDLKTDTLQQVTNNFSGNSYFPIFLKDGRVAYVDKKVGDDVPYEIQYSTVPNGDVRSFDVLANCYGEDPTDRLMELSYIWHETCQKVLYNEESGYQVALMLNLSDENCRKLAKESGDSELTHFCGVMKDALVKTKKVTSIAKQDHPGEKVLAVKCQMCHADKSMDWFQANAKDVKARIDSNKASYRMPIGGSPLSAQEKKDLMDYITNFKK